MRTVTTETSLYTYDIMTNEQDTAIMDQADSRYWVIEHDPDTGNTLDGWFGVVDETQGGIVAYFFTEQSAIQFSEILESLA